MAIHDAAVKKQLVLPIELERVLTAIGTRLERGESVEAELPAAIAGIFDLPVTAISQAASTIAYTAKLHRWREDPSWVDTLFRRRLTDKEQLLRLPDLRYLFLFHLDGRIREAALQRVTGGLPSPFMFAAVAFRLNDWAEQVRDAALRCATRCFPLTAPDVIAEAASVLLLRQDTWERWGNERQAVEATFARQDVVARLADLLINARPGPSSRIFRSALKHDAIDPYLERIATTAKQPSVRAVAVQAIADMTASWRVGTEWKWIDKSLGLRTRVPKVMHREICHPFERERIVADATSDRSAVVRRTALSAVIRDQLGTKEARKLALKLQADPSLSVRERAAFILSRAET